MNRSKRWILCLVLATLPLAGCSRSGDSAEAPPAAQTAAADAAPAAGEADERAELGRDPTRAVAPTERKLIQNAELSIAVKNYAAARLQLDETLTAVGGYVANAQVHHDDGSVSRAELTLRVPSARLGDFLASTASGGKVVHERLDTQDITDAYVDTKARLDNAKRLEGRLLAIMSEGAKSMKDLLEVEREIARVREEIERFEGSLRLWDKQVAMSTVKLSLITEHVYVASAPPTLSQHLGETLTASWTMLVSFGRGLLLLATALVPWLLPLALVAWCLRAIVLRIKRRYEQALTTGNQSA